MENDIQAATVQMYPSRTRTGADFAWARRVTAALPLMARSLIKRPWLPTSEFLNTSDEMPDSTRIETSDSLMHFQSVLTDASARDVMREQLERAPGSENFEFLLAFHSFQEAANPLQRFTQLSHIVNSYVCDGAKRRVQLSDACRQQLLAEFSRWEDQGRLPLQAHPAALEAAAAEVNLSIISACQQPLMPVAPVLWANTNVSLEDSFFSFD